MPTPIPHVILGSPGWLSGAGLFLGLAALLLLWNYGRATARPSVRVFGALLKAAERAKWLKEHADQSVEGKPLVALKAAETVEDLGAEFFTGDLV